jgi:hypothetical protein
MSAGLTRLIHPLALMTLIKNLTRHSAGGGRLHQPPRPHEGLVAQVSVRTLVYCFS